MKIHIDTTISIPRPRTILQFTKWAVLPLFALILALSWGGDHGASVSAQDPGFFTAPDGGAAGGFIWPDFYIEVANFQGQFCTSGVVGEFSKKCRFDPGSKFIVEFSLNTLGSVPDYGPKLHAGFNLVFQSRIEQLLITLVRQHQPVVAVVQ